MRNHRHGLNESKVKSKKCSEWYDDLLSQLREWEGLDFRYSFSEAGFHIFYSPARLHPGVMVIRYSPYESSCPFHGNNRSEPILPTVRQIIETLDPKCVLVQGIHAFSVLVVWVLADCIETKYNLWSGNNIIGAESTWRGKPIIGFVHPGSHITDGHQKKIQAHLSKRLTSLR